MAVVLVGQVLREWALSCLLVLGQVCHRPPFDFEGRNSIRRDREGTPTQMMTLAGLESAIFGSEDQRLIH